MLVVVLMAQELEAAPLVLDHSGMHIWRRHHQQEPLHLPQWSNHGISDIRIDEGWCTRRTTCTARATTDATESANATLMTSVVLLQGDHHRD